MVRRTKADACAPDGSPLFARRVVNTEGFTLGDAEKRFYDALQDYLRDGYNAAEMQGQRGTALGFVMTIFQKIAASSFAAVKLTLQRRLLMLTIHEAIQRDESLDVDGRDRLYREALDLIVLINGLPSDVVGRAQAEQVLAEAKVHLLKKRQEVWGETLVAAGADAGEIVAAAGEESAAEYVSVALPQERKRIAELLATFPDGMETKNRVLLDALRQVWRINPEEKVVVFATYLGTVDNLKAAIEREFPDKGVEVLKGGDHGAKTAAQRRFKRKDGPRLMVCTAAGREGINLQFARVLFNFDLPWNPMDLEQRIGRIHRYGQKDTAQVYNLVAADTIEGRISLMLEEKLRSIALALGKVDDQGQVAEDLRSQVLGQLSSQINYDKLYQEALRDPSLRRTQQEIEVAMANANLARDVVFELFQDLDGFNLGDYRQFDDEGRGMQRLVAFVQRAARLDGGELSAKGQDIYELRLPNRSPVLLTTDRDKALDTDNLDLLGLEHPVVKRWLEKWSALGPGERSLAGVLEGDGPVEGVLTIWHVVVNAQGGQTLQKVLRLALNRDGQRAAALEQAARNLLALRATGQPTPEHSGRLASLIRERTGELLHRELTHTGLLQEGASYSTRLLACAALTSRPRDS